MVVVLVVLCCSVVSDFVITLFCYLNTISMYYSTVWSVSYKDMADGNFTSNQRLLGNYVHEMEILLLAKIRRMATKHVAKNDRIVFPPRSASRTGFIL